MYNTGNYLSITCYNWKTYRCLIIPFTHPSSTLWKERNVLFNDALKTFLFTVIWVWVYGKGPLKLQERRRKEGNILFNDALNTFYLRLYGVTHMVNDHSDSERGNSKVFFYMHHPTDRITHTTAFVTPVVEHWLEREIAQWVHHEGSTQRGPLFSIAARDPLYATSRRQDSIYHGLRYTSHDRSDDPSHHK